jgi:hypothetical protein
MSTKKPKQKCHKYNSSNTIAGVYIFKNQGNIGQCNFGGNRKARREKGKSVKEKKERK